MAKRDEPSAAGHGPRSRASHLVGPSVLAIRDSLLAQTSAALFSLPEASPSFWSAAAAKSRVVVLTIESWVECHL